MANGQARRGSLFTPLVLIVFGILFLLHFHGGLPIGHVIARWWPLLLIFLGLAKLAERMTNRQGTAEGRPVVTAGEIFLLLGLLSLVGVVVLTGFVKGHLEGVAIDEPVFGEPHSFDADVPPMAVPAGARIEIRSGRGDITVHAEDTAEIQVSAKKNVRAWSERDARRLADPVKVEIVQEGGGYVVRVPGDDTAESRVRVDLDVSVPAKSTISLRNERGDIDVSEIAGPVSVSARRGDAVVRDAGADVGIEVRSGDVKVSDVKGNVKISGKGSGVEVMNAAGGLTIEGEFESPIHAENIAKGVRFVSHRTDLTLAQLSGHFEINSGNMAISDSTGNFTVRTHSYDMDLENITGKIKIENRDATVSLRFSSSPKADIEVTNSSAGIVLTLPASAAFEISADCHSCDIESEFDAATLKKTTTQSGDAHLEGKLGTRGPKIILKTSYGSIAIHKGT